MKTIKKWIIAAVVANLLLLPATLTPATKAAETDSAGAASVFDCCSESAALGSYCCKRCCWLPAGCHRCGAERAKPAQDIPS